MNFIVFNSVFLSFLFLIYIQLSLVVCYYLY
nr:MAG TPA: hypothetical protein [Caudoviricetes sp.]